MFASEIHGLPVIGWVQTETQSTGPCGIVLVQTRTAHEVGGPEFCTAWYRQGDHEWGHGHYFTKLHEAWEDFTERAARSLPGAV